MLEALKIALTSIYSNRLRSILTTLGVVIGVSAVIALVSIGEGSKEYILAQIGNWGVGANSLTIHPGEGDLTIPEMTITYADTVALREKVSKLTALVTEAMGRGRLQYGHVEYTPAFSMGTSPEYPEAFKQKTVEGRFFSRADALGRKRFAVIGKTVSRKLFGGSSPVGEKIKINGTGFLIIGLLEEKGSMMTFDMDDMVLIPDTLSQLVLGTDKIFEVFITVENETDVPGAMEEIHRTLLYRHKKIDFHIHTQQGIIDIYNNILNALTGIVSAIAAISLLVGGIGIMNIMLVAVTERTREIGIRKALGAKNKDIFMQFLAESILITLSGAFIGVLIGTGFAGLVMFYLKLQAVIAYYAAFIACFVALLVGIFFGVYPAMRASRLNPVDALRFEL